MMSEDKELFNSWYNDPKHHEQRRMLIESLDKMKQNLIETLTPEMVSDIRKWRVEQDCSWRTVAALFCDSYITFSEKNNLMWGNQITGMELCDAAMIILNEKPEDGWN